jgi:hypothetical protein
VATRQNGRKSPAQTVIANWQVKSPAMVMYLEIS